MSICAVIWITSTKNTIFSLSSHHCIYSMTDMDRKLKTLLFFKKRRWSSYSEYLHRHFPLSNIKFGWKLSWVKNLEKSVENRENMAIFGGFRSFVKKWRPYSKIGNGQLIGTVISYILSHDTKVLLQNEVS